MMEREKLENIWAVNMKLAEDYWQMWRSWAENMSLWQEKSEEMVQSYIKNSKQVFDEHMKWMDAFILQASKGQQQMQMVLKEMMITGVENMMKTSFNPWLEWAKNDAK